MPSPDFVLARAIESGIIELEDAELPSQTRGHLKQSAGTGLDEIGGVGWPAAGLTPALPWGREEGECNERADLGRSL